MNSFIKTFALPLAVLGCSVALFGLVASSAGSVESGPKTVIDGDGPVHASVAELSDASDSVVLGHVNGIVDRQSDNGGDPTDDGVPMIIVSVTVTETIAGAPVEDVINVATLDPQNLIGHAVADIDKGDDLVLFLDRFDNETAKGLDVSSASFYVPVGFADGLLAVDGNRTTALGENLLAAQELDARAIATERAADSLDERIHEHIEATELSLDEVISAARS